MAKKLIALILSVMLVLSLMTPVFAVETPAAATAADTRTVNIGVINYLTNELGATGWQVHYWLLKCTGKNRKGKCLYLDIPATNTLAPWMCYFCLDI